MVLAVVIGLWGYYTFITPDKALLPVQEHPITPTAKTEPIKPPPIDEPPSRPITETAPAKNGTQETTYQVPDEEKLLYSKAIKILVPKGEGVCYYAGQRVYQRNMLIDWQETIKSLEELIGQYPNSLYLQHYQETIELIQQMIKEDKETKYGIKGYDRVAHKNDDVELSLDEEIESIIHYLRWSCFYRTQRYELIFNLSSISINPRGPISFFALKLVNVGTPAVPSVVNLLDDRRPIIADDTDKIPAKFYRYQDAAVEILQTMFSPKGREINPNLPLATKPFPLELPQGEYFSEYIAKQTTENKQKIISDIKAWVEESIKNTQDPQPADNTPK